MLVVSVCILVLHALVADARLRDDHPIAVAGLKATFGVSGRLAADKAVKLWDLLLFFLFLLFSGCRSIALDMLDSL